MRMNGVTDDPFWYHASDARAGFWAALSWGL